MAEVEGELDTKENKAEKTSSPGRECNTEPLTLKALVDIALDRRDRINQISYDGEEIRKGILGWQQII